MKPSENKLAYRLDKISRPITDLIDNAADSVTQDMLLEHRGFTSFVLADDGEDCDEDGWRASTDEEAATIVYQWWAHDGEFDLRKPLPAQVAEWLRVQADLMSRVAEAIESVTDDRDLDLIARLVNISAAEEAVA
ncbi:hypothetical protein [Schlesneria sp. DSM 10557]|uniref:hypothetical protein n=1 Tax=Schlesneria sp. DSM 10557 TaxID=3044399 RepID=UPI00359F3F60